jgi:hypothetical protein
MDAQRSVGTRNRISIFRDTSTLASIVLTVGTLAWKVVSVWSDIDFLLSIRKQNFALIFNFIQSIGWVFISLFGAIWLVLRLYERERIRPNRNATWSMVGSCSIVAFLFGVLITVKSTGIMPLVVKGWGNTPIGCTAIIDTSRLLANKDRYKMGLACGLMDTTTERLEDERITISNPFQIIPGEIPIAATYRPQMIQRMKELQSGSNNMWFEPLLIPNGVKTSEIKTLGDLLKRGGKLVSPS